VGVAIKIRVVNHGQDDRLPAAARAGGRWLDNPIERCWGILEQHWNRTLRHSVEHALRWAGTMTWRTIHPLIGEITTNSERGVRLTKTAFRPIAERLTRSENLPKWCLTVQPTSW
jgi:hypothetical protein